MGEFFKGWRRKVGSLTLVLALVFMVGWVRSFYVSDVILFPTANAMNTWISDKHGLVWLAMGQTNEEHEEQMKEFDVPFVIAVAFPQSLDLRGWKLKSSFYGFEFFERHRHELTDRVQIIPYWSLTIPLTVISFWLLLSKPNKSTQKKIAEPVTGEGT
jgi:hypothetical protein